MSEHDDTLLDEDLGDEEYDLGNDEEEALLADDYELERQNSYKGEEETDDVLDLGVTDALDDLDAEDENVEFNRSNAERNNDNDFYEDADHQPVRAKYYEQQQDEMNASYKGGEQTRLHDGTMLGIVNCSTSNIGKGDLREKLQKNAKIYAATGPITLEDEECEEARERRNRFQNERTIVSPKMNSNIPDSLENVVTCEPNRLMSRGRGRGRSARGCRGGRFATQNLGNFNPRFANTRNSGFDNQPPPGCRPPLLETRPPFPLGAPNSVQNQQLLYQQQNAQTQHFQHYTSSSSVQPPAAQFVDNRPQFNPNQFQGQMGPRLVGPRLDYGPRSGLPSALPGQPYNHSQNQPPFVQMQGSGNIPQGSFQNSSAMIQENQLRLMHNNPSPLLHRNLSGGSGAGGHLGNLNPMMAGTSTTLLQGNPSLPVQGFPRQPLSQQGPLINHPNANQMSNQTPFENRPPFQESTQFENRSVYDTRSGYSDQVPTSQFNSNTLPVPQQSTPNVPTVPLPSGHKILINPHFRGAVQSVNDASLAWDSGQQQQTPLPSHIPSSQFSQSINSYQNQNSYNQATHGPPHYQQNYQHNKKDDPYAYFSDVWQENKPQKCLGGSNSSKQYSSEAGYPRDDGYEGTAKYKSDQWEQRNEHQPDHRGAHQSYRDRDLSSRSRGLNDLHLPKPRTTSSTIYRESYNQNHVQKAGTRSVPTSIRAKVPQKRTPEPVDRPLRDLSPKRMKPNNRNLHEVRTVDTLTNISTEKKEEESDPEMLEYRKKMEEQKRLREKILREKENRRKMAAMEKQNEKTKKENNTLNEGTQETKSGSVLMGVAKDASVINKGHNISVGRGRGRPINAQSTEANEKQSCIRIVRKLQTVQSNDSMEPRTDNNAYTINEQHPNKILGSQPGSRRVVIQKPLSDMQKFAIIIQKAVSNLQRGQLVAQNKLNAVQGAVGQRGNEEGQSDLSKKIASVGQKGGDLAKQKSPGGPQRTQGNVHQGSSQRIVLQKTPIHQQQKKTTEIKTNTVKVENLAASTSEPQIRRMCQGIGTIESIQMGERSATIVFKTQSAATVFHKKYQRKMVDLSLITVRLVPQSSGNKSSPASVVKVS